MRAAKHLGELKIKNIFKNWNIRVIQQFFWAQQNTLGKMFSEMLWVNSHFPSEPFKNKHKTEQFPYQMQVH